MSHQPARLLVAFFVPFIFRINVFNFVSGKFDVEASNQEGRVLADPLTPYIN
jgi:hypothetical protein